MGLIKGNRPDPGEGKDALEPSAERGLSEGRGFQELRPPVGGELLLEAPGGSFEQEGILDAGPPSSLVPNVSRADERRDSSLTSSGEGRVFGSKSSSSRTRSSSLPEITETIVVGGDRRKGSLHEQLAQNEAQGAPAPEVEQQPVGPPIDQQILEQAQAQAQEILQQAQMQSQQMLQQLQIQSAQMAEQAQEQARQQGYQEGFQQGLDSGQEQASAQYQELFAQARSMLQQAIYAKSQVMVDMEPAMVRLALKVAERILGQELATSSDAILSLVRQAVETLKDREEVVIKVHPDHVESVKEQKPFYAKLIEGLKDLRVVGEPSLELGSCVLETNLGNVDAKIETQLEAIRLGLEETMELRKVELNQQLQESMPVVEEPASVVEEPAPVMEESVPVTQEAESMSGEESMPQELSPEEMAALASEMEEELPSHIQLPEDDEEDLASDMGQTAMEMEPAMQEASDPSLEGGA